MVTDILKEAGMNDPCVSKESVETKLLSRGDSGRSRQKFLRENREYTTPCCQEGTRWKSDLSLYVQHFKALDQKNSSILPQEVQSHNWNIHIPIWLNTLQSQPWKGKMNIALTALL